MLNVCGPRQVAELMRREEEAEDSFRERWAVAEAAAAEEGMKREERMRADQQQSLLLAAGREAEALAKVALYATSCKDSQEVLSLLALLVQKYRH